MAVPMERIDPEYPKKIGDKVVRTREEEYHHRERLEAQQNKAEMDKTEIEYLTGRYQSLVGTIGQLRTENEQLKAQLEQLKTENNQLKDRLIAMQTPGAG